MCQRKQDITQIEFLDYCKDGILDLVKSTYNNYYDKRKLLKTIDDDKKNCLHLVSYSQNSYKGEYMLQKAI